MLLLSDFAPKQNAELVIAAFTRIIQRSVDIMSIFLMLFVFHWVCVIPFELHLYLYICIYGIISYSVKKIMICLLLYLHLGKVYVFVQLLHI